MRIELTATLALAALLLMAGCPTDPQADDDDDDTTGDDDTTDDDVTHGDDDTEIPYDAWIYVDPQIGVESCEDYDATSRVCGAGGDQAFDSLAGGAAAAVAGTAVFIREGTYTSTLEVQHSGTESSWVTFTAYEDELVTITGESLAPGIELSGREYVLLDGLTVDQVRRWMYALDAHHNIVRNNTFSRALDPGGSSKTGLFFQEATFNRIVGNTIEDSTQDNLALHACDHNVIEGNTIRTAAHTLWAINCGNFNIIRGNTFENEIQKIGEIYDCEGSGFDHEITSYDDSKHNLVEHNDFLLAVKYYSTSGGNGIQYAGQEGIIRHNLFVDTNAGLGLQRYSDEANFNTHNRAYNNVFYNNQCGGSGLGSQGGGEFADNLFKNNIYAANRGCEDEGWAQIIYRELAGFEFAGNAIYGDAPGGAVIQELFEDAGTLADYEASYPALFHGNLDLDPLFGDAGSLDFVLQANSPMIDAGEYLTTTDGAGAGTIMQVADARYFFDGFGIQDEVGDRLQLAGQATTARILSIDYESHTLTLDSSLTWDDGVGVGLPYEGSGPDLGAFESGS